MNEGIACCPENRTSTREAVVDAMLASGDELAQLQPALNLLSPPLNATPGEALLASCYEAGADHNADEATRAVIALPAAVVRSATPSLQRSGLLCMAAGALSARQLPLTHNRLCDVAGQFARAIPEGDEEAGSGFYTVRSVSLPVYRRLRRDNHSHSVCLQQALLHLLAWKSESPWARQQAQRLLWQGGVLGEKGEFALLTLDDELRERQIVWPALRSLLAVTGFGEKVWGSLVLLLAGVGIGTASYQTWLQLQPPGSASCAGSQPNLIEQLVYFLSDNVPSLFEVSGLCEDEELVILGLSLANWALVSFSAAFVVAAWALFGKLKNTGQA